MAKSKKKKARRNVVRGIAHIQSTFNNTIVTITDGSGDTLCYASAGTVGLKGSRKGMKLFLKGARCFGPKCPIDKEHPPPGMHGMRRSKTSEYGVRLREKQRLKRFYGLFERQFRRFFALASRAPENTGEMLL